MKTSTLLKTMLACFMLSSSALALAVIRPVGGTGGQAQLSVTGETIPKACDFEFAGGAAGGVAAYGQFALPDLSPTAFTSLGTRDVGFQVGCSGKAAFALSFGDTQAASLPLKFNKLAMVDHPAGFGLGKEGAENIGGYSIKALGTGLMLDQVQGEVIATNDGSAWVPYPDGRACPDRTNWFIGFRKTGATTNFPSEVKDLTGTLQVNAFLNLSADFPAVDSVKLKGLANIVLNYVGA